MLGQKSQRKKKVATNRTTNVSLESSLTSMDWLPTMKIGENPLPTSTTPTKESLSIPSSLPTSSLPITLSTPNIPQKLEPTDIELPTSTTHSKPRDSYVALIRQAILSSSTRKMTLSEIYQWIVGTYPYFRSASPKWKNSIRHNLSLNKTFKKLQRGTNDPGKGSYWAIDESNEVNHQSNSRKRGFATQKSLPTTSSSSLSLNQKSNHFHDTNPSGYSDVNSTSGQSFSADESDSTMSFAANSALVNWDDPNLDSSTSMRRFPDQILDTSFSAWMSSSDNASTTTINPASWVHDLFPHAEANSFFENGKIISSSGIDLNDVDVKPYCEIFDGFRSNATIQQQDRDKLLNLASSLSSFFDSNASILTQTKITNDSITGNRLPIGSNSSMLEANNLPSLPVVIEDETFDWFSIA